MTTEDRSHHDQPTSDAGDRMTDETREEAAGGRAATTVAPPPKRERPEVPQSPAIDLEAEPDGEPASTADVARAGSATDQEARGSAPATDTGDGTEDREGEGQPAALFAENEASDYRDRWQQVQTEFVDDPRQAVQRADTLVAELMKRLAESFAAERSELEAQWDRDGKVSTEDLRVALQRYRSFFDRLLSL